VVLILLSGLFSAIETAYSSASQVKLKNMNNDHNAEAGVVLEVLGDFDRFLTTVLIANNIVNIAAATIGTLLFTSLYGEAEGSTISTIVITVLVLIFGEVTPKSIAKRIPEKFAVRTVQFVRFLEVILIPLVFIFKAIGSGLAHLVKVKEDDSDFQDELLTVVDEAEKEGNLEEHESDLISAAIEFNDVDVKDVLTPRVDVVAVDITATLKDIEKTFRYNSFSRLPVYENSIDNIVGVIHEKDFYSQMLYDHAPIRKCIKPVIYTTTNVRISTLLKQLQGAKLHLAVVLDEYGGTEGIITLEDIIEELVGEIWDEHDTVKEYYTKLDDHSYLIKGDADADDMFERLGLDGDEDEDDDDYITVSGWAIHELEHIPRVGEEFDYKNLHVTVTKADQRKVLELKVEVREPEADKDSKDKNRSAKEPSEDK
jgi:CBS domain containing-hemolysin-like protein